MKISINKDSLLAVTQKMLGIVERNTTTPALSCILFRAEAGNRLIITATNREITSVIRRCAEVVKPGTALLPGKKLNELLRECQSEDITIETTRLNTTVTSGKSKFKLTTLSPDDFPVVEIPDNEDIQCLTLTGDDLKNLLGKVAYATANDNGTMTNMAGVFIEALPSNGKLVMVATNGHRLSLVDANIPGATFAIPSGVTIPDKAVTEIKRLVDKAEKVFVGICKGDVVVKTDDAYLKLKTITASYPDYKRIIAPKTEISLTANRKDFLQAVRRVSVVSDNGKTDLSLSVSEGRITFAASSQQYGEAEDFIDVDFNGEKMVTGFSSHYLIEAFSAMDEEIIVLGFSRGVKPLIVKPQGRDNQLAIIMPVKAAA